MIKMVDWATYHLLCDLLYYGRTVYLCHHKVVSKTSTKGFGAKDIALFLQSCQKQEKIKWFNFFASLIKYAQFCPSTCALLQWNIPSWKLPILPCGLYFLCTFINVCTGFWNLRGRIQSIHPWSHYLKEKTTGIYNIL